MAQKIIQGAAYPYGTTPFTNALTDAYFNIVGLGDLGIYDHQLLGGYSNGAEAQYFAAKHTVDFDGAIDRFTMKLAGNNRETTQNYRVRVNDVDAEQWVLVFPFWSGTFVCTGDAVAFDGPSGEYVGDDLCGYVSSATCTNTAPSFHTAMTTCEIEPVGTEHQIFRAGGLAGGQLYNLGVPPPAWSTYPISGSLYHYRSNETLESVVGSIDDTQRPLQMLARASGTFGYMQVAADPTVKAALLGLEIDGVPIADWDTPPRPFVAISAAEATYPDLLYRLNSEDSYAITAGSRTSVTAYDQPVGPEFDGNFIWGVGVNWTSALGNAIIDHFVTESWVDSQSNGDGLREEKFNYVGTDPDPAIATEWFSCPMGTFHPMSRAQIAASGLGWAGIEVVNTFATRFQNLRAYCDLNTSLNPVRVNVAQGNGAVGDLNAEVLSDIGWYEDAASHDDVPAGTGWCWRFKARPDDSEAILHISGIAVSYSDDTGRSCLTRVLPQATEVLPEPCLTHRARSVKITRVDGEVFAYTEHDEDIVYAGTTYKARRGFSGSATEIGAALGDVGNMEISGFTNANGITVADLYGGKFDGALVEVRLLPWGAYLSQENVIQIGGGVIGKTDIDGLSFKMEALSLSAYMKQRALVQVYTPTCRYALGDSRCTVVLASLTVTGAVTGLSVETIQTGATVRRRFTDSSRVEEAAWFDEGEITFTSGLNAGQVSKVKVYAPGSEIVLWEPLIYPIAIGDEYSMSPGCIKTEAVCRAKFDNFINFGGYPTVPGSDATLQTPTGRLGA